eukprot:TRINITY_DN1705_c0_g1_i3.p1 TRINITY_DN1705_c0_g1~~TRINITY_DN1705_c0_g1_i3.p1  ORF type:complete len:654 (+),score=120.98 TRINITY_DN1705_c0_g1_i3:28-1989(+)
MDGPEHENSGVGANKAVPSCHLSAVTILRELAAQIGQSLEFFGQNHIVFRPRELTELDRILRDNTTTFENGFDDGCTASLPDSTDPRLPFVQRNYVAESSETVVAPDKILATIVTEASTKEATGLQKSEDMFMAPIRSSIEVSNDHARKSLLTSSSKQTRLSSRISSRRHLEDESFREQVQEARKTLQEKVAACEVKEAHVELSKEMEVYSAISVTTLERTTSRRPRRVWTCRNDCKAEDIVHHRVFESISAFVITLSAVMMGLEVELSTFRERAPPSVEVLSQVCTAYFMLELAIRIFSLKNKFFSGEDCFWNGMDSFFVLVSVVELLMATISDAELTFIRILKMVRIVRVFRIFRVWRGLWDFALMIVHSMKSLLLALILLFLTIYVIAVALTMNSTNWLRKQIDTASGSEWVSQYNGSTVSGVAQVYADFGSISRSSYTLLQAVLGGVSWGEVTDSIMHVDALSTVILLVYIMFIMLAVLNIITGVFVEEAVKTQQTQKDFMVEQEMKARKLYGDQLLQLFETIDADVSGNITFVEICAVMEDEQLAAYLRVLGFEIHDAERLFRLLDSDLSGEIQLDEFVDGAVKLKGVAQSIDVFEILHEIKNIRRQLADLRKMLAGEKGLFGKEGTDTMRMYTSRECTALGENSAEI